MATVSTRQTTAVAAALFILVVAVLAYRAATTLDIPGSPQQQWLCDFRDAIYYPVVALLDGKNPYDAALYAHTYPVWQTFALYSPLTLLVHLPFGLLPFPAAEIAYFCVTVLLTLGLAYLTLTLCGIRFTAAGVLGAGALLLLSRPGYANLLLGQCTLQVAIGTYLALGYARTRIGLAALGLTLATLKPTFGGPLVLLMLSRRDVRAVVLGLVLAGIVTVAVTVPVVNAAGGLLPLLSTLPGNYAATAAESTFDPVSAPMRVDAVALVARFLGRAPGTLTELSITLTILGIGMIGIHRLAALQDDHGWRLASSALAGLTIVICTYHQVYDLLLLALPIAVLALWPADVRTIYTPRLRWLLLALLVFPAANHLISGGVVMHLGLPNVWVSGLASLNGIALLTAFFIHFALAFRAR